MSLDISPLIPAGRQLIQSYRGGIFRISDIDHPGAVIVFPERTLSWSVTNFAELTVGHFEPVSSDEANSVEILLLGCGANMQLVPREIRAALKQNGIVVEPMDTGAACRTFNVLMGEDRRVCAALLPSP